MRYPCRKGAKSFWEELYEDHYKELVAYGTRMGGSKELAEDLVQETFVKALMNTETVADLSPSKQRAWLYRTFKNLFFDRYRRAVLENEYEQSWKPEYLEDHGIQEIENAILLQSITPQDRAIFQLRYFDGYSAEEISQMMNLPPGTIRSKLSRCRKYLKRNLDL
ncbi:MAG: RNA polymerase sigma factor [Faecousia sp.]